MEAGRHADSLVIGSSRLCPGGGCAGLSHREAGAVTVVLVATLIATLMINGVRRRHDSDGLCDLRPDPFPPSAGGMNTSACRPHFFGACRPKRKCRQRGAG